MIVCYLGTPEAEVKLF